MTSVAIEGGMSKAPLGGGSSAQTGRNLYAPLDTHERHATANSVAEQARLEYRRGEWYAGSSTGTAEFDAEQAHIGWRAGK